MAEHQMSIEALKAIQAERGLQDVHLLHIAERGFTMAHTDRERAKRDSGGPALEECAFHRWMSECAGPPEEPGVYVIERHQPDPVRESYRPDGCPFDIVDRLEVDHG